MARDARVLRLDVQGLRAVAVLLVVAYHAGLGAHGGFTGVDVFFVISGFVITELILAELEQTSRFSFAAFYARRVRRLLPALAVVVLFTIAVSTLAGPVGSLREAGLTGMAASVFGANAYLYTLGAGYFDASTTLDPLLHTWTLAVEEQFYVLFPTVIVVTWVLVRGRRAAALVVGALSVLSAVLAFGLAGGWFALGLAKPQQFAFYASPTRAWEFGAGALVALGVPLLVSAPRFVVEPLALAGAVAVVAEGVTRHDIARFPGPNALVPVLGTAALIAAGCAVMPVANRVLSLDPLVWIGNRSYSIYLWHWPLIVFARALFDGSRAAVWGAALLSFVPAALSYTYVEQPVRRHPWIVGGRVVALAVVCSLVPLVASGALASVGHSLGRVGGVGTATAAHLDVTRGCDDAAFSACAWPGHGTVFLVGDSNAGHFSEALAAATRTRGFGLRIATAHACPFARMLVDNGIVDPRACLARTDRLLRWLVAQRPKLVVIAASSEGFLGDPATTLDGARSPAAKARVYERGLRAVAGALQRAHVQVLIVHPVPIVERGWDLRACAVVRALAHDCGVTRSRASVDAARALAVTAENAVARHTGATTLDLEPELCTATRCSTTRGHSYLYWDWNHITPAEARALAPVFARAL